MFNKYSGVRTKGLYSSYDEESLFFALERRNANHVIEKLNSQNLFLSKNVRELICENIALKNKLYYAQDNTYTVKQKGRNDVAEQWRRLQVGARSVSPMERKGAQRSPLWKKKQQQQNRKDQQITPLERQYSPGADSNLKRKTIIEELSESHFQSRSGTSREKEVRKGLFLSKRIQNEERVPEKMVKSSNSHQRLTRQQERKQSETEQIILPDQQSKEANPEKSHASPEPRMRHKKNNSPYLQADSRIKAESSFSKGIATPYKKGGQYNSPAQSRQQRYTNIAYLNTTAK